MITLEANYSKKIGLPNYSSHQFSVTLKSELSDLSQVQQESTRLYTVLQQSVDSNIQQIGYLPGTNGNGHQKPQPENERWNCSDKQRTLIQKIVTETRGLVCSKKW
jgi:thiamine kinase-like enzyme